MITKIYKCSCDLSIGAVLSNGVFKQIRFIPYSFGGSIYETNNPLEIEALDNHKEYGKMFTLFRVEGEEGTQSAQSEEPTNEVEVKKVEVTDIDEAKEYLVENYGIKRTSLRSTVSIKNKASELHIEFVGI